VTDQESNITKTQPISESTVDRANSDAAIHKGKTALKHRTKKLWLAFITVFISGAAIGSVCVMAIMQGKVKHYEGVNPHEMIKMRIISHMSKELNLSPEQKDETEKIITAMTKKLFEIRKAQQPEIQNIVKSSFSNIDKILNDDQKIEFKKMQRKVGSCSLLGKPRNLHGQHPGRNKSRPGGGGGRGKQHKNNKHE